LFTHENLVKAMQGRAARPMCGGRQLRQRSRGSNRNCCKPIKGMKKSDLTFRMPRLEQTKEDVEKMNPVATFCNSKQLFLCSTVWGRSEKSKSFGYFY
jgi:hypothetical protein